MIKITKYGAIDIGSNAIRLLLMDVRDGKGGIKYKKRSLVRVPLRLGEDVFVSGKISSEKIAELEDAMIAFRYLMKATKVERFKACSTSAMRDSENGAAIIKHIKKKTGIEIEIISGEKEAELICGTQIENIIGKDGNYLYVDVGGGSTELTFFSNGKIAESGSFNIGTIRLLNNKVSGSEWDKMNKWLKKSVKGYDNIAIIGSGGNINKIYKLLNKKNWESISRKEIEKFYKKISGMTVEERVVNYNLNFDRADVLGYASDIFMKVVQTCDVTKIFVPKVGLVDGLVKKMHES